MMGAAAALAIQKKQARAAGDQPLKCAPECFRCIRHKKNGKWHWSREGAVPCCPPPPNWLFVAANFEPARAYVDRMCGKCVSTARSVFGVHAAQECAEGRPNDQ